MRGFRTSPDSAFELQQKRLVVSKHEAAPGSEGLPSGDQSPSCSVSESETCTQDTLPHVFEKKGSTIDLIPNLPRRYAKPLLVRFHLIVIYVCKI
jgi:hypothetical protein